MRSSTKLLSGLAILPFALNKVKLQQQQITQCLSPQEEAEMLTKMMHEQGGQLDPEEMQAILRKARGQKNRKPPRFMALMTPVKQFTMFMPNDGFRFEVGIPFSQKF